jgi:demethylmenaquinone methyltransferase/2-methoxy-6-polyprenyl-1,4-benzoquinol methylase
MALDEPATTDSMRRYYARRAAEYEHVYAKPERQSELRALEEWLAERCAGRRGVELACGTGWWTPHAASRCASWLATDINDEVLAIARAKPFAAPERVRFARRDAYDMRWLMQERHDLALAAFWWSHLRRESVPAWLESLHAVLEPGARVVFIDNRFVEGSSTPISRRDTRGNSFQQRRLADGSTHEVLKNFPTRDEALAALGTGVHSVRWRELTHFWTLDYELD